MLFTHLTRKVPHEGSRPLEVLMPATSIPNRCQGRRHLSPLASLALPRAL